MECGGVFDVCYHEIPPPWDVIRKDGDTPSRVQFDDKVYLVAL